jgi:3-ketosteroid 9alpha-monooxygenase subunit A
MVERFEIEVDTSRANEYWNAEVEENLKAREVSGEVPAEQH